MYIHIGQGSVILAEDIVGIFDLDITSQSHITRAFLRNSEKRGIVENAAEDIPKTFILCSSGGKDTVYLSQPAAATLLKRAESNTL